MSGGKNRVIRHISYWAVCWYRVEGLGSSRKFGFKFPVSGSVLFSSMGNIYWSNLQSTLGLEYQDGDGGFKILLAEYIVCVIQYYSDQCQNIILHAILAVLPYFCIKIGTPAYMWPAKGKIASFDVNLNLNFITCNMSDLSFCRRH